MTRDNPYPNARHRTEDWDPAGKSEEEKKHEPGSKPNTNETVDPPADRPRDSTPAEIADFEQRDRKSSDGVEREQEPDSQSRF